MATATKRSRNPGKPGRSAPLVHGQPIGLHALRKQHALSQGLTARLLGVSVRTISGIESGTAASPLVRRTLTQLCRLFKALGESMEANYLGHWLEEPNEMLAGLKPVEAIERGQLDLVWQIADGLRTGSPL